MFGTLRKSPTTLSKRQGSAVKSRVPTNWPFPKTLPPGPHDKVRRVKPDMRDEPDALW